MNDDDKITLNLKWYDDLLANTNGTTQFDLFSNSPTTTTISNTTSGGFGSNSSLTFTYPGNTGGTIQPNWTLTPSFPVDTGLHVNGDANFEGDVKIKGKSLNDMFESIEQRLAILHPNEELEAKWEELRELRKQYVELEKEILEKEKMWGILKK